MTSRLDATALGDDGTIAAVSTALGRGALAMVRVSGPATRAIAAVLLDPTPTTPRRATHSVVRDASGAVVDDVVATLYVAPQSFTGEDLLEVSTHGGLIVPAAVLAAAIRAGAREAQPGEFTRRAVLNGKLDLLQAEAIGDLINAKSSAAHRQALRQLDGGLTRRVGALREQLIALEALLAYDIDFPEEDDGPLPRGRIVAGAQELIAALDTLLASEQQGNLVHEGALVVLAGSPNVGKSSLFNALLGEARAIVTDVPGTTRDAIEAVLDLPGWPLRLVDTAGLRETNDVVEQHGIETSTRYLGRAAIVLACVDSLESIQTVRALQTQTSAPIIIVATKADVLATCVQQQADVVVSAHTGAGLGSLLRAIEARLISDRGFPVLDAPGLTRARHRAGVEQARRELDVFIQVWSADLLPASVAATHIRAAANALSDLIGTVAVDDVLDVVFRSFCVGK